MAKDQQLSMFDTVGVPTVSKGIIKKSKADSNARKGEKLAVKIEEMVGIIICHADDPSVLDDISKHLDRKILGKHINNPTIVRTIESRVRKALGHMSETEIQRQANKLEQERHANLDHKPEEVSMSTDVNTKLMEIMLGGAISTTTTEKKYLPVIGKLFGAKLSITKYPKATFPVEMPGPGVFDIITSNGKRVMDRSKLGLVVLDFSSSPLKKADVDRLIGEKTERIVRHTQKGVPYTIGLEANGVMVAYSNRRIKNTFILKSLGLNSNHRANLTKICLDMLNTRHRKTYHVFPAHPSWITRTQHNAVFNIVVSKQTDMFKQLAYALLGPISEQQLNVLRIRAGKDGWGAFIKNERTQRYTTVQKWAVIPESKSEINGDPDLLDRDGIVFVKNSDVLDNGDWALIKGVASFGSGKGAVVKTRALAGAQADVLPDGSPLPDNCDGWCYASAIKWANVPFDGRDIAILDVKYGVTKNEMNEKEAYKFNLFYTVLGDWKFGSSWMHALMGKHTRRSVSRLNNLDKYIMDCLARGVDHETERSVIADSTICKKQYGFMASTEPAYTRVMDRKFKEMMSTNTCESMYAGIYHATHVVSNGKLVQVPKGGFIASQAVHDKCKEKGFGSIFTGVRYPNTTRGSFLRLEMDRKHTIDGASGLLIVVDPAAQILWQSDGDDHVVLLPKVISNVTVDSPVPVLEKHVRPAEGELTPYSAYHHGRRNQELTGVFTAAFMKAMSYVHDFAPAYKDKAEQKMHELSQSIQDSVQGIKKYNDTTLNINEAWDLSAHVISKFCGDEFASPTAAVISGKFNPDTASGIKELYGHTIAMEFLETSNNLKPIDVGLTDDEKALCRKAWVDTPAQFNRNFTDSLLAYIGTSRKNLVKDLATIDPARIIRAAQIYAQLAYELRKFQISKVHTDEIQNNLAVKIRSMNGMFIALGYLAYE